MRENTHHPDGVPCSSCHGCGGHSSGAAEWFEALAAAEQDEERRARLERCAADAAGGRR